MNQNNGLSTRPVGKIRIYGCGGGGVNIGKEYLDQGHSGDIANIEACFIDTSDANLEDRLIDKTWLFDDLDGSGAVRQTNVAAIQKAIPDIIRKFPAADVNIVIFTLAGGTGSVAGPLLLQQLLADGHMAVAIVIGAKHSGRNAENTLATVKTLDAIRHVTGKPVVMHLGINSTNAPTDDGVDREAHLMITSLAMLCSRRNHRLDTADLRSLFDFTKSTSAPAQMCRLHVTDNTEAFNKVMKTGPLAAAYLLRQSTDPVPDLFVPYSTYGTMPAIAQASGSLFFGIESGSMVELHKLVADLQKEVETQKRAATQATNFVDAPPAGGSVLVF
ncbi:hypothetical protein PA10_00128 [Pseudomonas phage pPa_SNUABM_DT01]|nr:hypothetical protein PA10_00128 [Pseudomonas phage pPa_SNUABM_DT01]